MFSSVFYPLRVRCLFLPGLNSFEPEAFGAEHFMNRTIMTQPIPNLIIFLTGKRSECPAFVSLSATMLSSGIRKKLLYRQRGSFQNHLITILNKRQRKYRKTPL